MTTVVERVSKRGDSAYVLIPAGMLRVLGFGPGDQVQLIAERNRLVVRAVDVVPKLNETNKKFADDFYTRHQATFRKLAE